MSAAVIRRRGAMLSAMGSENAFDNACYFLVSRLCVVAEPVGQLRVGAFQQALEAPPLGFAQPVIMRVHEGG